METISPMWKGFYSELGQVDPKNPTDNKIVRKTMTPPKYNRDARIIAAGLKTRASVLELGCGYGGLAKEILDMVPVLYTVVDNTLMLNQARKTLGDGVRYVDASEITTLSRKKFKLFISNFCLDETPIEYQTYILEKIIKNCRHIFLTGKNDTFIEQRIMRYFDVKKTKYRFNQSRYIGRRKSELR